MGVDDLVIGRLRALGFFLEDNQPMMWRGRMLHRALDPPLRECGDAGEPLMSAAPDSESARELRRISEAVVALERGSIVKPLTVVSR